jgi:hypothetical protein
LGSGSAIEIGGQRDSLIPVGWNVFQLTGVFSDLRIEPMANPTFSVVLDTFEATVQRSKDRLIAIPAKVQARLGLRRRANNHLVCYSIRKARSGRWNRHYAKLTSDNEFGIPADVSGIRAGDHVEVKLHRVIPDTDALAPSPTTGRATAGAVLLSVAEQAGEDPRRNGSHSIDEELYGP